MVDFHVSLSVFFLVFMRIAFRLVLVLLEYEVLQTVRFTITNSESYRGEMIVRMMIFKNN